MLRPHFLAFLLFLCCAGCLQLPAQIVINEYSASNKDFIQDGYGGNPDWIELYNNSSNAVSLAGLFLSDSPNNLQKYALPSQSLAAGQVMLIFASNRNAFDGMYYHTNFKLTQMKAEKILLSNSGGTILDSLTMIPTQRNHSRGRLSNGAPNWGVFTNPTPALANSGGYAAYAAKPQFNFIPGFYPSTIYLVLTTPDPNITIRYTTNGDIPSAASTAYGGSIPISATTIVRARAFSSNPAIAPSFVENNTYFINANHHHLNVISVASPDYPTLFGSGLSEIMTTFEFFDSLGHFQLEQDGDIRPHGNDSWAYPQKGIRYYVRDDYGYANNMDYQFFEDTPRHDFDVLILKAGASDNYPGNGLKSCHLRDVFAQTLSVKHGMNLDERNYAPTVLYINGQYWGIYEIRERVDADYANYYYQQDVDSVDMLAYWGGLTIEEGSDTAWNSLYNFMVSNNLSVPANHAYVDARLDLMSIIDYFILNTYLVNTDWLNWNTAWWRGRSTPGVKWRYRLWDEDNIFNLGQNYTGVNTTSYLNDPCNPTTLFPMDPNIAHTAMITALFADTTFENLYINRYADLLNTAFDCDTLLNHLQWIVNLLSPEMPQHVARWGGSVADWNANLDSIRVQINGRCHIVDSLMAGCYNLTGPYDITVLVDPPGFGDVRVNTVIPTSYPYIAGYFGGVTMNLFGVNTQGHPFLNWTINHHALSPSLNADSVSLYLSGTDTIVAHFDSTLIGTQPRDIGGDYQFKVYPTLVKNKVVLEYQIPAGDLASGLTLTDMRGHVVADLGAILDDRARNKIEIDLAALHLSQGMYFMTLQTNAWRKTGKLIWMGE